MVSGPKTCTKSFYLSSLEELLNNRKREEVVQTLIKIDRVKGMIETIALRKKFLKHLQEKRISKARAKAANCKYCQTRRTPIFSK